MMAITVIRRTGLAIAILIGAIPGQLLAAENSPVKSDFFNQSWRLNPGLSHIYMQSVKKNAKFETHKFLAVDGKIDKEGMARVTIDLASVATGVDLRDVRMRFLFFETFKFPKAEITAQLDKAALSVLHKKTRIAYTLKLKLDLHGIKKEIEAPVIVTRIVDNAVSVSTIKPIIINAADFSLKSGIARLSEAVGGILIAPAASITFDLVFEGTNYKPELELANIAAAKKREQEQTASITIEECKTRMDVISKTRAIYFSTASAKLNSKSEPLLNSVAQISIRCPSVRIEVSGHTDSDGKGSFNQKLSEKRARSVSKYLIDKGVDAARITTIGYGDTRPIASNNSKANKAKNRRIEFKVSNANIAQ